MKAPFVLLFAVSALASFAADSQVAADFGRMRTQHRQTLQTALLPLKRNYAASLDQLVRKASASGDFELAMIIKTELKAALPAGQASSSPVAPITVPPGTPPKGRNAGLAAEFAALQSKHEEAMKTLVEPLNKRYAESLAPLAQRAGLAGEIETGAKIQAEMKAILEAPKSLVEMPLDEIEKKLEGSKWSFPERNDSAWVRLEKDGRVFVSWANSTFGRWKVTAERTLMIYPFVDPKDGRVYTMDTAMRSATSVDKKGKVVKPKRLD